MSTQGVSRDSSPESVVVDFTTVEARKVTQSKSGLLTHYPALQKYQVISPITCRLTKSRASNYVASGVPPPPHNRPSANSMQQIWIPRLDPLPSRSQSSPSARSGSASNRNSNTRPKKCGRLQNQEADQISPQAPPLSVFYTSADSLQNKMQEHHSQAAPC